MQAIITVLVLGLAAVSVHGNGRAFPADAKRFTERLFQSINPGLRWDPTNYLVDLSGYYALCEYAENNGKPTMVVKEREEGTGAAIGGYFATTVGHESYVDAVNKYLEQAMPSWINQAPYKNQIAKADRFGCSVQPGCRGNIVAIACLFSPRYDGGNQGEEGDGGQNALAFTEDQYKIAEAATGMPWESTETLTALSGYETDCAMIGRNEWFFARAQAMAEDRLMSVSGDFGVARNRGDTTAAVAEIARGIKPQSGYAVGCSIIPDCMYNNEMYVVVSCLYSMAQM